jgi:hypothetical protein
MHCAMINKLFVFVFVMHHIEVEMPSLHLCVALRKDLSKAPGGSFFATEVHKISVKGTAWASIVPPVGPDAIQFSNKLSV